MGNSYSALQDVREDKPEEGRNSIERETYRERFFKKKWHEVVWWYLLYLSISFTKTIHHALQTMWTMYFFETPFEVMVYHNWLATGLWWSWLRALQMGHLLFSWVKVGGANQGSDSVFRIPAWLLRGRIPAGDAQWFSWSSGARAPPTPQGQQRDLIILSIAGKEREGCPHHTRFPKDFWIWGWTCCRLTGSCPVIGQWTRIRSLDSRAQDDAQVLIDWKRIRASPLWE